MKHSERGGLRLAKNVRQGHTIRWCDRDCLVVGREFPIATQRWMRLVVDVPGIGERSLSYERTESVRVVDFTDPRLPLRVVVPRKEETQPG